MGIVWPVALVSWQSTHTINRTVASCVVDPLDTNYPANTIPTVSVVTGDAALISTNPSSSASISTGATTNPDSSSSTSTSSSLSSSLGTSLGTDPSTSTSPSASPGSFACGGYGAPFTNLTYQEHTVVLHVYIAEALGKVILSTNPINLLVYHIYHIY